VKQGIKTIKRRHARNFVQDSSQKRLDEVVPAYNAQVLNALSVDYVTIFYYNILKIGTNCTCEKHDDNIADITSNTSPNVSSQSDNNWKESQEYEIVDASSYGSMFGDNNSFNDTEDDFDDEDFTPEINVEKFASSDTIFAGNNINCGICYRSGFLPGYSLQRGTRIVLTTFDIVNAKGYHIDSSEQPYVINRLTDVGYIEYTISVPKYYKKAVFSIRNNHTVTRDVFFDINNNVVTQAYLSNNAGKKISIRVKADQFTHAVIEFHYDADDIRANIPNINKTLDYTLLETIGNLQVILPMTIGNVSAGDHIAIPTRNLYLKVVDIESSTTSTNRKLEWRATCRVLQPQESLRKLFFNKPFI